MILKQIGSSAFKIAITGWKLGTYDRHTWTVDRSITTWSMFSGLSRYSSLHISKLNGKLFSMLYNVYLCCNMMREKELVFFPLDYKRGDIIRDKK